MTYKVKVENVSKVYDLNRKRKDRLLSLLSFGLYSKERPYYALRNISFEVEEGDSVGIVGLNGSGKTTLSDLLGEVTQPTTGNITIRGKSSLIAINAGLNQELTGEENIRMKCLMYGMSEAEIDEKFDQIVEFSELEEFIDQPIKTYSSGMKSRLGFAISAHSDPDVLIVDEALSVGDDTFASKSGEMIKEFQAKGKTIFFVSHSAKQVGKMCNKAIWLHYGEMVKFGACVPVANEYARFVDKYVAMTKMEQMNYKKEMLQKQKDRSKDYTIEKEKPNVLNVVTGLGLTGAFIVAMLFQLNVI
ncbi:ABC transporter ATP-binding protein [Aliicoccus persicus]|uniref:ABC transporter ATP-binding protein n=1 Tax=Aliicoccus persicus TaxID=930138 RepID=A0A662Z2G4_9STAP|nr:ABC transporter ATP-binding protein [Aliicoccus persicus]SEV94677.1 teichoic acid transport system ATP-binding protein [Aliicoccus persicus]HJE19074.1 ABC transporter ATP-binding protein [Aliicoccus persicus]